MSKEDFLLTNVVPILGICLANLMYLSSLPAILSARKANELGELNPTPYPFIWGNATAWMIYGFLASDPYVFLANGSGVFLGMFFVLSSQALAPPPTRHTIERLVFFVLTVLVSMGVTAAYVVHGDMDVRASVVGTAAATMNVIMFSNPLAIMVTVCKTKNPSALSIPLCITSTCCASLWSTYAIAVADIFIFIANFPGVVVGIIQVIVIAIYRRSGDGMAGSKSQVAYSLPHDIEVPPAEDDLGGTHGTPHAGVIMAPISGRSTM